MVYRLGKVDGIVLGPIGRFRASRMGESLLKEDRLPLFKMGGTFVADVPAIDKKDIEFKINYISPLGSFATWKSTKQTGSYDLRTFEIHALPVEKVEGLRPGMSVLYQLP